ncbi:MAG: hypothetical protein KJ672_05060, partial [Candidatus Thermoplasmatota archaeon]|nr:hypothetical protein [Candidatus Thermoplasmatota archaeon]
PAPETGGLLVVKQEQGSGIDSAGIVAQSASVSILKLTLTCEGRNGAVGSITPMVAGAILVTTFQDISLTVGQKLVLNVSVDTSSLASGSSVTAWVTSSLISSTFADVVIVGEAAKAYVAAPPTTIQIDGAFGDWVGRTSADVDSIPVGNANVDLDAVGAVNSTDSSYFYVSVVGQMCGGSYVPMIVTKPSGGGGGGIFTPTRKTGEDILRIYIDSDLSQTSGYLISIPSKTIGADYLVEIKGLDGEIRSKTLMSYGSDRWNVVPGSVINAANDLHEIELGILSAQISGSSSWDYVVETTDWNGRSDLATSVPQGTRAWVIDGTTTSPDATAMSYQRKLFYDGTNFWSFYWDGTDTVYKYSTDSGVTWTVGGSVFKTSGVNEASIWWDSSNSVVYVVGDTSGAKKEVEVQKGTVSPATHAITWQASDAKIKASDLDLGGKNTFISVDASGYVWLLSSNLTSTSPNIYQLTAWRSSSTGDISSFSFSGSMILGGVNNQPNIKGTLVPAGTGSDVWAVYIYSGSVHARKYTGSWSAQTTIYNNIANTQNQDLAPPSAVVDGAGVIHVVYGNGHEQPVGTCKPYIYYVYNTGSGWSVPYRLESVANNLGNVYPTISADSSTGSVCSFWIETDTNGVGVTVMGKKNVSGTWTALTLSGQTAGAKQYLNSIYSAPGEQFICWQWTQNTTSPIEVLFDKLPEFKTVVLPVLFLTLMVVVGMQRRRGRSGRDE